MPTDETVVEEAAAPSQGRETTRAPGHTATSGLRIGDTLTVVSGRLGDSWVVEDEDGVVYMVTATE